MESVYEVRNDTSEAIRTNSVELVLIHTLRNGSREKKPVSTASSCRASRYQSWSSLAEKARVGQGWRNTRRGAEGGDRRGGSNILGGRRGFWADCVPAARARLHTCSRPHGARSPAATFRHGRGAAARPCLREDTVRRHGRKTGSEDGSGHRVRGGGAVAALRLSPARPSSRFSRSRKPSAFSRSFSSSSKCIRCSSACHNRKGENAVRRRVRLAGEDAACEGGRVV